MTNATVQTSQRQDGFNGGIQMGTVAGGASSRKLDSVAHSHIARNHASPKWRKGLSAEELHAAFGSALPPTSRIGGFRPDGGIFMDDGENPLVVVECKFQGAVGNAIERWYKNFAVSNRLGVKRYVTFCLGDGFFDGNTSERILATAVAIYEPEKEDIWASDEGVLGFYRWRTVEEAQAEIPALIDHNLKLAGWSA